MVDSIFIYWLIIIIFGIIVSNLAHFFTILVFIELLWILIYFYTLVISVNSDNLFLLSITFIILVFSAAESSIGFILFSFNQNCIGLDLVVSLNIGRNKINWLKSTYETY